MDVCRRISSCGHDSGRSWHKGQSDRPTGSNSIANQIERSFPWHTFETRILNCKEEEGGTWITCRQVKKELKSSVTCFFDQRAKAFPLLFTLIATAVPNARVRADTGRRLGIVSLSATRGFRAHRRLSVTTISIFMQSGRHFSITF